MKNKLWDRLILYCGTALAICGGIALFVQGVLLGTALTPILGVLLMAFGGYQIVWLRQNSAKHQDFVIQRTDSGELRIAVKAVENQVQKCIDLHEEIQVNSMKILNGREGVVVELIVTLDNNISIPLAVASLQKQIKQYLIASSGIEVKEVRVSVESTQDSPDEEAEETEAEQPAEKPAAKEQKPPLHQRLFGRPDEPAIVPEPPKEEEILADEEAATEAETEEAAAVEAAREQPVPAVSEPEEAPAAETPASSDEPEAETEDEAPVIPETAPEQPEIEEAEAEAAPDPLPESDTLAESEEDDHE